MGTEVSVAEKIYEYAIRWFLDDDHSLCNCTLSDILQVGENVYESEICPAGSSSICDNLHRNCICTDRRNAHSGGGIYTYAILCWHCMDGNCQRQRRV